MVGYFQSGTIKIPLEPSSLIFFNTLRMSEKGRNAYKTLSTQFIVKALILTASEFLYHEQ